MILTQYERDKPLSFHWKAKLLLDALRLPHARKDKAAARAAILLDAMLEARGAGRLIAYSRNKDFYRTPRRYRLTAFSYRNVVGSVDELVAMGWLGTWIVPKHSKTGWQSVLWAPPALLEAVSLPKQVIYAPGQLIRLRDADKRLIDYRETAFTRKKRRNLQGLNESLAELDITLPGAELRQNCLIFRGKDGVSAVNMARNQLYRVFNGNFRQGGRSYGHFVQGIPSEERKRLLFDGEPTLEADYKAIHAVLAYKKVGKRLPPDPYDVDGYERAQSKRAFQIALNAPTEAKAVGAIAKHVFPRQPRKAKGCLAAVKAKNRPIEPLFGSGVGSLLQRQDADIMENVQTGLNQRGIVGVPVHDSAIVKAKNIGVLQEEMARAAAIAGVRHIAIETKV